MIEECDAVTVPTRALADYLRQIVSKPVYVIPDRLDFSFYPNRKERHFGDLRTVVWYGYADNQPVLDVVVDPLHEAGIQLVVVSDRNYINADVNIKYNGDTIADDLMQYDAVLNVQSAENIKFAFKSNNKTIGAWALGLPVIVEFEDMARFKTAEARQAEADARHLEVLRDYDVRKSAAKMESVIMELVKTKTGGNHV